jgi:hypothetical protein
MIKNINVEQAKQLLNSNDTFIINILAAWCTDCTEQAKNTPSFTQYFTNPNIPFYQLNVQETKNVFISAEHQQVTDLLGGRGYPRTVLIKEGIICDADNVEIISSESLRQLAEKFKIQLTT